MFRYIALVWNSQDADACSVARDLEGRLLRDARTNWSCGLSRKELSVFYTGASQDDAEVIEIPSDSGLILGTVYPKNFQPSATVHSHLPKFAPHALHRISSTAGRSLVQEFWGSYVLIQTDDQRDCIRVLRGPMSDLPCFHMLYRGVSMFFAVLEDCIGLGVGPFSINHSYLRAIVVHSDPRTHETALNEVQSVDVGECVTLRSGQLTREWYWHPGRVASSDAINSVSEAAAQLRSATQQCVHATAARHKTLVHLLSGGNDSTIVALCLKSAPTSPVVKCLNFSFSGALGNERRFAQVAAQHCEFDLTERIDKSDVDLRVLGSVSRTPSPHVNFSGYYTHRDLVAFARDNRADAIFSGSMGDCVFGRAENLMAPAEFIQRYGIRPRLLRVAYDVGMRERLSMWRVLGTALDVGLRKRPRGPWSSYLHEKSRRAFSFYMRDRMLTPETVSQFESELSRFIHPWLQHAEDVPMGKLSTIAILTMEMAYDNPFVRPDDPIVVRPLTGQPLVECSLRIASFLNVVDGWDRAIARRAFASDLPKEILRRNTKSSPAQSNREMIDRNAAFIREFLLDGVLVRERLLDRRLIEAALPHVPTKAPAGTVALMHHLYTEAWARHWTTNQFQRAA